MGNKLNETEAQRANRDPITGAPGSHPVGTGIGAATGGAAGAAIGAAGGPVGAVVGAAAGAVVGGLAGKAAAEQIDPTVETVYWRKHYVHRPYVESGAEYEVYEPAYRYGWEAVERYPGRAYDAIEPELEREWAARRGSSKLDWTRARPAVRDAYTRISDRSTCCTEDNCP